jgi:outer membrane protein OmpA-like peptidoglycan-associated protein
LKYCLCILYIFNHATHTHTHVYIIVATHLLRIENGNLNDKYFKRMVGSPPKLNWERDCLAMLSNRSFINNVAAYKPYKLSSNLDLISLLKYYYLEKSSSGDDSHKVNCISPLKLPPVGSTDNNKDNCNHGTSSSSSMPLLTTLSIANTQRRMDDSEKHIANLNVDKVQFSSKTCGSLLKWCICQLHYGEVLTKHDESILQKVDDAKIEVESLSLNLLNNGDRMNELNLHNDELEQDISQLNHEVKIILKMLEKFRNEKQNEEATTKSFNKTIINNETTVKSNPLPPLLKSNATPRLPSANAKPTIFLPLQGQVSISKIPVTITQKLAFEEGSSKLTKVALKSLNGVLNVLNECESKICIEANQTTNELPGVNKTRGRAVKEFFISHGISPARLRTNISINTTDSNKKNTGNNKLVGMHQQVSFYVIQELRLGGTVEFSQMSSSLKASSNKLLDDVVSIMKKNPFMFLKIEGHTDNRPSWGQSNVELSNDRAVAVCNYISNSGGIEEKRLLGIGVGEDLPIKSNNTSAGRQANRRVEFHLEDRKAQQSLKELLQSSTGVNAISNDENAIKSISAIASGKFGSMGMRVRQCAADVLISSGIDWEKLRLLYIAILKEDPIKCFLGRLNIDVLRIVLRLYFQICK